MATERKIITIVATFLYPPLPARAHDWEAFYEEDQLDDDRDRGYGRTAADAINDLTTRFPRED